MVLRSMNGVASLSIESADTHNLLPTVVPEKFYLQSLRPVTGAKADLCQKSSKADSVPFAATTMS